MVRPVIDLGDGRHQVPLSQGMVAVIDSDDAVSVARFDWYANKRRGVWYACRAARKPDGKRFMVHLHRELSGAPDGLVVDHVNGDTLDNRKSNLRVTTQSLNARNRAVNRNSKSGIKGVFWNANNERWIARIDVGKRRIHLGSFRDVAKAAEAYRSASKIHHGEFARMESP